MVFLKGGLLPLFTLLSWQRCLAPPCTQAGSAGRCGVVRLAGVVDGDYSKTLAFNLCVKNIGMSVQWRETRTIGTQIKDLKAQLPTPDDEGNTPPSPVATEVAALEEVRRLL